MNPKKNKKLCPHCEGEIDKDALYCLYCGADLGSNLTSEPSQEVPEPLYRSRVETNSQQAPLQEESQESSSAFSLPLLLSGVFLLVFGLFLLFFSDDGYLTLTWDASFWFVYLLAALPLIVLGLKLLKKDN
jgi:hypothetical protein